MINVLILSTSLLALSFSGDAASQDSSLQMRNLWQQMLALEYAQEHTPKDGISSDAELTLFLDGLVAAWKAKAQGKSTTYTRLNSYVPMWIVRNVMGHPEPMWARCLAWQRYAAPAFLADAEDLKQTAPNAEMSFIIKNSNLRWASLPAAFCEVPSELWRPMSAALRDYPGLVGRYLEANAYADEKHREALKQVQEEAAALAPILDVADALYDNDNDGTFAALAAAFGQGSYRELLAPLGGRLAFRYRDSGELGRALAVLDLVGRSTTEQTLSRDTLRVWYQNVDPEQGPVHFHSITGIEASELLVSNRERVELSGTYATLSGEPFTLDSLRGRLVLLDFWSVGCIPCFEEVPALNALSEQYSDRLVVVGISSDLGYDTSVETVRAVAEQHGMDYLVLLDTPEQTLMKQFGVGGWPTYLLIGEQGELLIEPIEQRRALTLAEVEVFLESQR